jgi:hypothetical protein
MVWLWLFAWTNVAQVDGECKSVGWRVESLEGNLRSSSMRLRRLGWQVVVSGIAAGPAGGVLFGVLNAGDPDSNPVGRFFYACMLAVLTPLHVGFPAVEEAGASRLLNVWPHIMLAWLLVLSWLVWRDWRRGREGGGVGARERT